jgi:hypothetical protein
MPPHQYLDTVTGACRPDEPITELRYVNGMASHATGEENITVRMQRGLGKRALYYHQSSSIANSLDFHLCVRSSSCKHVQPDQDS